MKKLRTVTLAAALLVASVPSLSTTADTRPFGFGGGFGRVGFGHGGFGGWRGGWGGGRGWGGGGWGWGGAGLGSGSGSPQVHSLVPHSPALITAMGTATPMAMVTITHMAMPRLIAMPRLTAIEPLIGHLTGVTGGTMPTETMAIGTTVTALPAYGYGIRHAGYGVSRWPMAGIGLLTGLRYGRSVATAIGPDLPGQDTDAASGNATLLPAPRPEGGVALKPRRWPPPRVAGASSVTLTFLLA